MKLGILGHFGIGETLLNGQTVKTNNLVDGLERYTDVKVVKIDTHGWTRAPFKLLKNIKNAFKACDAVIMLPAHNGVRVFAPILLRYKKKYKKKIFYDVIGGWLPEFLKDKKSLSKTLKRFDGIWTETFTMKNALDEQSFDNVTVLPNFKELAPLPEDQLIYTETTPFRLCTFSRVMKEKGIETATQAVKAVNAGLGYTAFELDIYGQVDSAQTEWFESLKAEFPEYIRYCGCVDSSKSVETLKGYFALLFPTYYEGEGFAGTLIDAFSAGVPVVASDWRYNSEIVTEGVGFLYPTAKDDDLVQILKEIEKAPSIITSKKKACIQEAYKYSADKVVKILIGEIEKVI